MAILSREEILKADDLPTTDVEVPEWGGKIRLRTLAGWERDEFDVSMVKGRGKDKEANLANIRARLVAATAVDEDGNKLFTKADVKELGQKSGLALDRCFEAARRLAGLSSEDVDELAGKSETSPPDDSGSA